MKKLMQREITIAEYHNLISKFGNLNIEVETPYGFRKILNSGITATNSKQIKISTRNYSLICSPKHKIKSLSQRFKYAVNYNIGDSILTKTGPEKIETIEYLPDTCDLYDIEVSGVKQYFSNGIISHNSAFLDSLCFCLFDKAPRATKASHILNINKTEFRCKFNFEISGIDYFIERKGVLRDKGSVRVDVDFWMVNEMGEKIDLNGKERDDTNKNIRDYIGSYDDYIMTVHSSQTDNQNFVDKSQRERKDLLYKFLDISIFDDLQKIAKETMRELQYKIREIETESTFEKITNTEVRIEELRSELQGIHGKLTQVKGENKTLHDKLLENGRKIVNVGIPHNIDQILLNIEKHKQDLSTCIGTLTKLQDEIEDLQTEISGLTVRNIDHEINSNKEEISVIEKKIQKLHRDKSLFEKELKIHEETVNHLETHRFDPDCEFCVENPFVQSAYASRDKIPVLMNDISNLNLEIQEFELLLYELKQTRNELEVQDKENTRYATLNSKLENLIHKKHNLIAQGKNSGYQRDRAIEMAEEYYKHQEILQENSKLETENSAIQEQIQSLEKTENLLQSQYRKTYSEIKLLAQELERLNLNWGEYNTLQRKATAYEYYIKSVTKDGVPYKILSHILPLLEYEVNQMLSQLCEFSIKFETSDDKYIFAYIVYSDDKYWPVEMTSGMERFILSQAIRSALTNITNLPKANFIAIDEGFGVLDTDNLNSVYLLFDFLKQTNEFILCISHIDSMRDMVDKVINIDKVDNFSKVVVE